MLSRIAGLLLIALSFGISCSAPEAPSEQEASGVAVKEERYPFPKSTDSLWLVANNEHRADSVRLEAMNIISFSLRKTDPDSGIAVAKKLIRLSLEWSVPRWGAYGHNSMASNYFNKSEYDSAMKYHQAGLELHDKIGNQKGVALSLGNIALIHERRLEYLEAVDVHLRSLKIKEEIGDTIGMSNTYGNLANIYMNTGQYAQALDNIQKCLDIKKQTTDTAAIAMAVQNMANINLAMGDTVQSIRNYEDALGLWVRIRDRKGQALTLNNLGSVYEKLNEDDKAMDAFTRSIEIRRSLNDPHGIANCLGNISIIYLKRGDYVNAEKTAKEAVLISDTLGTPLLGKREALGTLVDVAASRGDTRNELIYYRAWIKIRDSVRAIDAEKNIARKEISFEFEKRATADSIKNAEERKVKDAEIAAQNLKLEQEELQRYALYGGLALVIGFSAFAWNRFRVTRRQKGIIELQKSEVEGQKHIIEEKQKEIIDSINYAKRLQQAILPPSEMFNKLGQDRFLIYKPKDIVAGDFYFLEQVDDFLFIAAADSTGHGVPGAMVSVVCSNALLRSVRELKITEPGKILDKATELILETFSRSNMDVKDGMDISLCCINMRTGNIRWAGAHNPLWIVHPNGELSVYEPNKQPVGMYDHRVDFITHDVTVQKGDMLYLLTDGYADQFGGEKGKKFKSSNLRKLFQRVANLSCNEQREAIEQAFTGWKGNYEQVDDVCVVGFRY